MYKVLEKFRDLTDNNYTYEKDALYPRDGHKPKVARIKQLLANDSKGRAEALKGSPIIEKIEAAGEPDPSIIDEVKDDEIENGAE